MSSEKRRTSLGIKKFFAKHSKLFRNIFLTVVGIGLLAGTIVFAVFMAQDPSDLNKFSFIGFLEFIVVAALGFLALLYFGVKRPAKPKPVAQPVIATKNDEAIPLRG